MNIVRKKILDEYAQEHADIRASLQSWIKEVENVSWSNFNQISLMYNSASFLKDNIVVFNIKGNKYRLITKISIKNEVVLIRKIGTHAEYTKWKL